MSVRAELDAHGLAPRKQWGQNFLTDARLLESIADAAEVCAEDTVLEIGPGLGHLTRVLARRAKHVVAVEIDPGLATRLESALADTPNVTIEPGDILRAAPAEWITRAGGDGRSFKIVANLPYYITSAILRHVLEASRQPRLVVVMVQRQVAQRMVARPPHMNLLAVSVQFYARVRQIRVIPAGAFYPRPKVDSAIVRLDVFEPSPFAVNDVARFFEVVRAGFGERRKQLRNALMHGLGSSSEWVGETFARARLDPTRRAETLTVREWVTLVGALDGSEHGGAKTKDSGRG